mmetsp:Transcript_114721/g.228303  ORF Transcript_114721/g.228303 Transcript_114721/m.228303 type:complete len:355 (+) Transcript_114721:76-1140(+)
MADVMVTSAVGQLLARTKALEEEEGSDESLLGLTRATEDVLLKVVGNVLTQPQEDKFRRLRKGNRVFARVFIPSMQGAWRTLLHRCCWEEHEDEFVLPLQANLFGLEAARLSIWGATTGVGRSRSWPGHDGVVLLPQVLLWLLPREQVWACHVSRSWCAAGPEALAATCRTWGQNSDVARNVAEHVAVTSVGLEVEARCFGVARDVPDPVQEFDKCVRSGPMHGGDMRVSRVGTSFFEGFGYRQLASLVRLPTKVGGIDSQGRTHRFSGWSSAEGGTQFWMGVLAALRAASWHQARGAEWTWSERSSQGGKAQVLYCRRVAWVFALCADGVVNGAALGPRWTISVDAVQRMYLT